MYRTEGQVDKHASVLARQVHGECQEPEDKKCRVQHQPYLRALDSRFFHNTRGKHEVLTLHLLGAEA